MRVRDVERRVGGPEDGQWLALYFIQNKEPRRLEYMSSPGARLYVQSVAARGEGTFYYAIAGQVVVVASVGTTAEFLDRLLAGLDAKVMRAP